MPRGDIPERRGDAATPQIQEALPRGDESKRRVHVPVTQGFIPTTLSFEATPQSFVPAPLSSKAKRQSFVPVTLYRSPSTN